MKQNHLFGFESLGDFLTTTFGLKSFLVNAWVAFLAIANSLFTSYVYDTSEAVWLVVALFVSDVVTGIYKSYIKNSEVSEGSRLSIFIKSIRSNKLFRGFVVLFFHILLLGLAWNMGKNSSLFSFLPGLIYGGILGTQFVSIIENLFEGKVIKGKFYTLIKDKIDLSQILKNIFKKNDNDRQESE